MIEDELNTILPGNEPLANLDVSHLGGDEYSVLSARNGQPTVHQVKVGEPSCTCEDMEYNREDQEVCAHVVACMLVHDEYLSVEANMASVLMNQTATVQDHVAKAKDAAEEAERALVNARDVQSGTLADAAGGSSTSTEDTSEPEPDTGGDTESALETTEAWVQSQFTKPSLVTVETGRRTVQGRDVECVELDCDYDAADSAHETWQGIMSSKDKVYWDGDEYVNYVPLPAVEEVFG